MRHAIFKIGCNSSFSGKWRDRWDINKSNFPITMASNLIRRIASSAQTSKQGILSSERGNNPIQPATTYSLPDESTSVTPSHTDKGIYKVRDMSTNRLVHAIRRPDVTGLFNDPYDSEERITRLVNMGQSRHSSLIQSAVPAPNNLLYPLDSFLGALELSRVPCQKLEDSSNCYDFSQLFQQQSISSLVPECDEIDKSPANGQNTQCDPLFPVDLSKYHLLQLKENFLLQMPILLLSPNDIELTLKYVRSVRSNRH